jgi:hypothetical protein
MKILSPSGRPARLELAIRNYYEAARTSPGRSSVQGVTQNSNLDATPFVRRELIRKSRTLYKNSPYIRGLIERVVTLTVGTGIHAFPDSSSESYNNAAAESLNRWFRNPAIACQFRWCQIQRILFRSALLDGEVFVYLTRKNGRPMIRILEAQTIGSGISDVMGNRPDGIILDNDGDPVAYEYYPNPWTMEKITLNAASVVHIRFPDRCDLWRGVPLLHAIINTAHDIHDIIALEKSAVKDVSRRTDVIKTSSGELDVEQLYSSDSKFSRVQSTDSIGSADTAQYYEKAFGPEAKILRIGDEYTPYEPKRPGPAWEGFMDFLSQLCCIGLNFPPSLLLPITNKGADTRKDIGIAERVVEGWQDDLVSGFEEIINWVQAEDISDRRVTNAPADYEKLNWQLPKRLSVDYGRDSKSDREDVKMAMLSLREYYGREGLKWKQEIDQIIEEQAYIRDKAAELGLDPEDVMMKNPNQQNMPQDSTVAVDENQGPGQQDDGKSDS